MNLTNFGVRKSERLIDLENKFYAMGLIDVTTKRHYKNGTIVYSDTMITPTSMYWTDKIKYTIEYVFNSKTGYVRRSRKYRKDGKIWQVSYDVINPRPGKERIIQYIHSLEDQMEHAIKCIEKYRIYMAKQKKWLEDHEKDPASYRNC